MTDLTEWMNDRISPYTFQVQSYGGDGAEG